MASVTIELGLVKVMLFRKRHVIGHRIVPVTPRYFRDGLIANRDGLAGIIRNAVSDMGKGAKSAVAAVPGFQSSLWTVLLPDADGLDPALAITQEASRRQGITLDTSYMRWQRAGTSLDRVRWVVASASRRSMATVPDTLALAGLRLGYMELRPFALARAVNQSDAVIVSTYADGCDVVVVRDASPAAYTGLGWGSDTLDGPTLLNRLTEVVHSTLATHNQAAPEFPLAEDVPAFVFGSPVAREPALAGQLAAALHRPVGVPAPPVQYHDFAAVQEMMVNVGLALSMA